MTRLLQAIGILPKPIDWGARLQEVVERTRNSFEVIDYGRRRAAALKARGR